MRARRRKPIHRAEWSKPGIIERLGTVSDQVIATELGITRERVRQVRAQLGIADNRGRERNLDRLGPELRALLGTVKDSVLAAAFGVSVYVIRGARERAGIPTYRRPCGTITKYNTGCRCMLCRQANADRMADYYRRHPDALERGKEQQRKKVLASAPHAIGKIGWYTVGCRCEGCKEVRKNHVSKPRGPRPVGMEVSEYADAVGYDETGASAGA